MKNIEKLVKTRRSFRTFDSRILSNEDIEKISEFVKNIENPYGIPVAFKLLDAKKDSLTCPVVTGTNIYIGGKIKCVPYANEAFGYSFERLVLFAQSLGIGTVWLGGTMDRGAFERAMELGENEMMPCVSPLGYPAEKMSLREAMMRKAIKADTRFPFGELFFDKSFDTPLTQEKAAGIADVLEMVRWAPSAVNKQPWRVIVTDSTVHFYLKKAKGFSSDSIIKMQKVDLGISLCHFALAAEEFGFNAEFTISDPKINADADTEYIASYLISEK